MVLSDLTGSPVDRLTDVKQFLQHLIEHNAIVYQTDFKTREWTFEYYLDNAFFRLRQARDSMLLPSLKGARLESNFPKEGWSNAQAALDAAVTDFAKALDEHDRH